MGRVGKVVGALVEELEVRGATAELAQLDGDPVRLGVVDARS